MPLIADGAQTKQVGPYTKISNLYFGWLIFWTKVFMVFLGALKKAGKNNLHYSDFSYILQTSIVHHHPIIRHHKSCLHERIVKLQLNK